MTSRPEIEFEPGAAVIGDLHLDPSRADSSADLRAWIARHPALPRLAIVGDLFDAWIGPAHLDLPGARAVADALAALARGGTRVEVLQGNRDFLLDGSFERACGARVHASGFVAVGPDGGRTLAIHGDELCTLDLAYQRYTRLVRSRPVRWLAPRIPRPMALAAARRLRSTSVRAVAAKPAVEKEQQAEAARSLAAEAGAAVLLCGHAHIARDQRLPGGARWLVVGAFGSPGDVLRLGDDGAWTAQTSAATP